MKTLVAGLLLVFGLTACGGGSTGTTGGSQQTCSDIWKVGHTLPAGFHECDQGAVMGYSCHVYGYGNLWAQPGTVIRKGAASRERFLMGCK